MGFSISSEETLEKDIQLKSQPIFDHLQSSSEMEPPSSKGDLDGLNDRHKNLFTDGLLAIDPRLRERKKQGQEGARRKFTWKKR
ncbi:hypothetical protein QYM36_008392 [Artemia franciscana]|uniref:Uncharacterized protein n=1 Tax=Artemia franciscana TaxID=6661 RepID=A0AA88IV05_ARTSF|nr:hypothetical protein QYM36_008392 [Artemia franciscana]